MKRLITFTMLILLLVPVACLARPSESISGNGTSAGEVTTDTAGGRLPAPPEYKVYCGTEPRAAVADPTDIYPMEFEVGLVAPVAGRITYFFDLPAGTYYCAWTAYNENGESDYSNEVEITITGTSPVGLPESPSNAQ